MIKLFLVILIGIIHFPLFAQITVTPTTILSSTRYSICDPISVQDLNYMDTLTAIDEFVMSTSEGEVFMNNRSWWNFVRNIRQKNRLFNDVLGMPCDTTGNTPLHLAITKAVRDATSALSSEEVNLSLFTALLRKDAPLSVVNDNGESPIDMVKRMMGAEDLSNDTLGLYLFIYRQREDGNADQANNIFQRLCRSPEYRQEPLEVIRVAAIAQEIEYSHWLVSEAFAAFGNGTLPILMDMYQEMRAEDTARQSPIFASYDHRELRNQMEEDSIRCSGKSRYVVP